jgi:hypothetical protein
MTTQDSNLKDQQIEIARIIREECIHAATTGYERAAMSGLCGEGAWEAAISAVRMLDLELILKERFIS